MNGRLPPPPPSPRPAKDPKAGGDMLGQLSRAEARVEALTEALDMVTGLWERSEYRGRTWADAFDAFAEARVVLGPATNPKETI